MVTFKERDRNNNIQKELKKVGLSLGIIFSKEDIKKYELVYGSKIILNNAEIVIEEKGKNIVVVDKLKS